MYQQVMQRVLRRLGRTRFRDLQQQQRIARVRLESIQQNLATDPTNSALLQQESEARQQYISIISSSLDITRQQSKIDWIKFGDANTRFFHAKAKQRKLQLYLYSLKDDNNHSLQGFDAVSALLQDYYSRFLGTPSHGSQPDPQVVAMGPCLSLEQQQTLRNPFSDQEIRVALFSIPGIKSLGPDGFNSSFYKEGWSEHGPLVLAAIRQFFKHGHLPRYFGHTKLVLLPKNPSPENARDFRPISCCSVIYKTLTKLLASRLKVVLPTLIHANQGAFVPGRELLHNVLISQDLVRGYARKGLSPRCILKLDIHKAFDSVSWSFLGKLLQALCFPSVFVDWIMECILATSFTIHVNGGEGPLFAAKKGLKQGNPLSPLLFVLTMEYLSRQLTILMQDNQFGFHSGCR